MESRIYIDPERVIETRCDEKNIALHVDPYTTIWGTPEAMRLLRNTIDRALDKQRAEHGCEIYVELFR
jgi:hypothetical protein